MKIFLSAGIKLTVLLFLLAGCQTLKMPDGPNVTTLTPSTDAPSLAIAVRDERGSTRMGSIGGLSVKIPKQEVQRAAENYLKQLIYIQGLNIVKVDTANFKDPVKLSKEVRTMNSKGAVLMEITGLTVKSFDLILDPPDYGLQGHVYIFSEEGKPIFHQDLDGKMSSQAAFKKGKAEAVAQLIYDSLWGLERDPGFKKAMASFKPDGNV